MAKTQKMTINSSTGAEVPALVISPGKAPIVSGNFDAIEAYLADVEKRYADIELSTANIEDVQRIDKEMQIYRTSLEKIEKNVKSDYFNNPKKVFEGLMSRLYARVAAVESRTKAVLAAEDQKRIDGINLAIDHYIELLSKKAGLSEEYASRFERKKQFYNKTQAEKDTQDDLIEQAGMLAREQKAEEAAVRAVTNACAKDTRLNLGMYLDLLKRGDDVATVLEAIDESLRLLNRVEEQKETIAAVDEPLTIAEVADTVDFESDLPQRTKTVTVEITYPADCGDALTELFEALAERGIESRIIPRG